MNNYLGVSPYIWDKNVEVYPERQSMGGGGGSGTNIRTPLRSDMHHTLFFFLPESTLATSYGELTVGTPFT